MAYFKNPIVPLNFELYAFGLKSRYVALCSWNLRPLSVGKTPSQLGFVAHLHGKLKIALIYFIIGKCFFSFPIQIAVKLHLILYVASCKATEERVSKVMKNRCIINIEFPLKAYWQNVAFSRHTFFKDNDCFSIICILFDIGRTNHHFL